MLDKLLSLKVFVENVLPDCNVCISNLTLKSDIGSLTGKNVEEHLTALQLDITDNSTTSNVGLPLLPFAYNFNDLNEIRIKIG